MKRSHEHCNHAKFKIAYHLIFSTKYRKRCLAGITESVEQSFRRAEGMQKKWSIKVMEIDRDTYDHIHLLIQAAPSCRVDEIVHRLKQVSTYDIWQKHRLYMLGFYWSGKHHLWTRGYFCSSLGDISEEKAQAYIENQG